MVLLPEAERPVNQMVTPCHPESVFADFCSVCVCVCVYLLAQERLALSLGDVALVPGNVGRHVSLQSRTKKWAPF